MNDDMTFTGSTALLQPSRIQNTEDIHAVLEVSGSGAQALIPSWSVIRQTAAVGEQDASVQVARAAGRRVVEQYGEALERLAE